MRRRPTTRFPIVLLAAVLVAGTGACSDVQDRVDEVRSQASDLGERARFCLAVARAVTSLESGNEQGAADAAEEALAMAPAELEEDARAIAEALREGRAPADPQLTDAARRLARRTGQTCAGVG